MKRRLAPILILLLLAAASLALATFLQPRTLEWTKRGDSDSVLKVLLGDGRRLFANHFFVKADVYFHSGYYPSIFDSAQAPKDTRHMTAREGSAEAEEHERQMNFLAPPRDWIERFGRHFLVTEHTHLEGGQEREILPWLKLSAELDPERVETYTVAAFWLRKELGKVPEAEQFLREGLRHNPRSYELLFELGRLYNENYHDSKRARRMWVVAIRRWDEQELKKKDPDLRGLHEIAIHLARAEEQDGDLSLALSHLELASKVSGNPEMLRPQIIELQKKLQAASEPKALKQP
jgi:tetratricopeptide (TPR) repeat protein